MIFAQIDFSPGASDVNRTETGLIGLPITGEEIKDVVLAGVRAGLKR